uniref:Uncharacterized protein n=1 Tax=Nelumbo nucifera TaxID=4432 RepID=A0A822XS35_NELNU|nr:TPA_asm: hypothetical protein HUJ06_023414 [Nelumbo nucifera]
MELAGGNGLLIDSSKENGDGGFRADSFGCEPAKSGKFPSHNSPASAINAAHHSNSQIDAPRSDPLHNEMNVLWRFIDSPPTFTEPPHRTSISDDTIQPIAVTQAANTMKNQEPLNVIPSLPSLMDGGFTTNPLVSISAKSGKSSKFTPCNNVATNPDMSPNTSDWHPFDSTTEQTPMAVDDHPNTFDCCTKKRKSCFEDLANSTPGRARLERQARNINTNDSDSSNIHTVVAGLKLPSRSP